MWTDERAASTSAKIRGKKFVPSTQRLDRRRRRPGEVEVRVVRARPVAGGEGLGRRLRAGGGDGVRRRRPARPLCDPQHLPEHHDEEERQHEEGDGAGRPPTPGRAGIGGVGRVAEKRHRPDDGDRRQHRARHEHEEQAVGDACVQDAARVAPVLRRRPADHERAREHADDAHPGAALHRSHPQEGRACQEDAQPAVVRPFDPVEGQVVLGEPRAEHAHDDGDDRDPRGHPFPDRTAPDEGAGHLSRPFGHAARGLRLS